jgi:hypothetical protein
VPNKSGLVIFIFVEEHQINAPHKKNGNSAEAILRTNERGVQGKKKGVWASKKRQLLVSVQGVGSLGSCWMWGRMIDSV